MNIDVKDEKIIKLFNHLGAKPTRKKFLEKNPYLIKEGRAIPFRNVHQIIIQPSALHAVLCPDSPDSLSVWIFE